MGTSSSYQNVRQDFRDRCIKVYRLVCRVSVTESNISVFVFAGIIFGFALFYFVKHASSPFYHDSLYFWDLANSFGGDKFSFINYSNDLRGYLFPFLLFLVKKQAVLFDIDAKLMFQIYTALFFTVLSIIIVPWSFHTFFRWRTHLWGRSLIASLMFFFWRGYFLYPLSDIPAYALLLVGVTLLLASLKYRYVPFWVVFIGLFIGAAVNTRPVYQISLIFLAPLVFVQFYKKGITKGAAWISLIIFGFGLILLPQLQINRTHFNVNSPWVLARVAGNENLYVKQLFWGLRTQKYETTIGNNHPSIVVDYSDPFISNLQKTNLLREKTVTQYIKIMRRFPLELAVSYFRHFFNGLDIFFPTPYIPNIYANHKFFNIVNYLVWFLMLFKFLKLDLSHIKYQNVFGVMSFLAPVIIAIPTAVEIRFFLPAYVLAYGVIAFGLNYIALIKSHLNNGWKALRLIIVVIFWLLLCFTLSNATIEYLVR